MYYQAIFQRHELKYKISREQKERILQAIYGRIEPDQYARCIVRNVYFDTPNYRLIRRSLDKPEYKEKLRLRSYHPTSSNDDIFVELKKKYRSVVYKRRCTMPQNIALDWINRQIPCPGNGQIHREIDYFLQYYGFLKPAIFLSYRRQAYQCTDGSNLRITFDDQILCRQTDISLSSDIYGASLLSEDTVLMELKSPSGLPIWMVQILSANQIYKTSFSKYGAAYQTLIFPKLKEANYADKPVQWTL